MKLIEKLESKGIRRKVICSGEKNVRFTLPRKVL